MSSRARWKVETMIEKKYEGYKSWSRIWHSLSGIVSKLHKSRGQFKLHGLHPHEAPAACHVVRQPFATLRLEHGSSLELRENGGESDGGTLQV